MKQLTILIVFLINTTVFAQTESLWEIHLKSSSKIKATKIEFEKNQKIIFYDEFSRERIIGVERISSIMKIKNSEYFIDFIKLKNQSLIKGDILEYKPNDFVSIRKTDSKVAFIETNQIDSFLLTERQVMMNNSIEIGGGIGYPSALNIIFGCTLSDIIFRLSGSYIYIADGMQLNILYPINVKGKTSHSLGLMFGYSNIRKDKYGSQGVLTNFHWKYVGGTYNFYYNGFIIDIGLSYGSGKYDNPNPIYQIGYIYRFNI